MSKTKAKADKAQKEQKSKKEEKNYFYLDESVKNFTYSDFVRVNTNNKGMLFSFGKMHPELDKHMITSEVYVPLDVVFNLKRIIETQLKELEDAGVIQFKEVPDAPTE